MAQKLTKHWKNSERMSMGCDIDFTILLSMLKVIGLFCHLSPGHSQRAWPSYYVRDLRLTDPCSNPNGTWTRGHKTFFVLS